MMYRPLQFFCGIGSILFLLGFALGLRFLYYFLTETGPNGHIQSLILAAVLMMLGFQTIVTGLQADIIAANRKILEDIQKKVRNIDIQLQGKDDAH
ncbi:MAG TPA: hypothetical protein PKH81_00365 [Treponemataceae bacterium]|nr:hypothetical protein [Treponemataceae bacterium]